MPESSDSQAEMPLFRVSPRAARRIAEIAAAEAMTQPMLRLSVSGGGCSGFQYGFALEQALEPEDRVFECDGARVVVDEVSLELLRGGELDFVEDLMGAYFKVENPNAASSCGCGSSFSV